MPNEKDIPKFILDDWKNSISKEVDSCWERVQKFNEYVRDTNIEQLDEEKIQKEWNEIYSRLDSVIREFLRRNLSKVKTSLILSWLNNLDLIICQFDNCVEESYLVPDYDLARPLKILEEVAKELDL